MSFGAGPGLNLDLAAFSFQVPARPLGACACAADAAAITISPASATRTIFRMRFVIARLRLRLSDSGLILPARRFVKDNQPAFALRSRTMKRQAAPADSAVSNDCVEPALMQSSFTAPRPYRR